MGANFDFSGWATKNDLRCSDGRTIRRDAFKDCDGKIVPLVWNHDHASADNVLGHALLENREDGVYAYCTLNDTEAGQNAKLLVQHGDITSLSIYANGLKQKGSDVIHGAIRELSLVLAGANPGAFIDTVMAHSEDSDEEAIIFTGEDIALQHSEKKKEDEVDDSEEVEDEEEKKEDAKVSDEKKKDTEVSEEEKKNSEEETDSEEKTIQDVLDSMTEEQRKVTYALVGMAAEDANKGEDNKKDSEEEKEMKHNAFATEENEAVLSHAAQGEILGLAKSNSVGSLQDAISIYAENNELAHGFDTTSLDAFFPEYEDIKKGAPDLITRDYTWVDAVINGVHKSPMSRIRTRQTDVRANTLRGLGYKKGNQKSDMANVTLLKRTTDPQTIYIKDKLNRDDIIDITDFDVVDYEYQIMRGLLNEEVARAILVGDGRDSSSDDKISEEHIRPIWQDDDLYTIHTDIDLEAAKTSLQGSDTSKNFGDTYIFAEAIVNAALYSRESYKGSGNLTFYCTPHTLNQMLLARDLNGRRIYGTVTELAAALNVTGIQTVEQFAGLTRTTSDSKKKELLGLFVNLDDYNVGSTKGGEITKFNQFDIDFNQEKYLIETRLSGALTRVYSAIALEQDVTAEG